MISTHKINSRYAKSLFLAALENQLLEEVCEDMILLSNVCAQNRQLMVVLRNPMISKSKKIAIMTDIFHEKATTLTIEFIAFVIKKNREVNLAGIANVFVSSYKAFKKVKTVYVSSPKPLSSSEKEIVKNKINHFFDEDLTIDLEEQIDEELLGGFSVRFDDYLYDASILRKIKILKKEFEKNEYEK